VNERLLNVTQPAYDSDSNESFLRKQSMYVYCCKVLWTCTSILVMALRCMSDFLFCSKLVLCSSLVGTEAAFGFYVIRSIAYTVFVEVLVAQVDLFVCNSSAARGFI